MVAWVPLMAIACAVLATVSVCSCVCTVLMRRRAFQAEKNLATASGDMWGDVTSYDEPDSPTGLREMQDKTRGLVPAGSLSVKRTRVQQQPSLSRISEGNSSALSMTKVDSAFSDDVQLPTAALSLPEGGDPALTDSIKLPMSSWLSEPLASMEDSRCRSLLGASTGSVTYNSLFMRGEPGYDDDLPMTELQVLQVESGRGDSGHFHPGSDPRMEMDSG